MDVAADVVCFLGDVRVVLGEGGGGKEGRKEGREGRDLLLLRLVLLSRLLGCRFEKRTVGVVRFELF